MNLLKVLKLKEELVKHKSVNPLISALVEERAHSKNHAQPLSEPNDFKAQKIEQQWAKLSTEPIYLLKITVKVGVQSLKLDGSHLGIRAPVLQLLIDSQRASSGYTAKISKRLKDAANKLQARQKIIYNRYTVHSEPFRFVHESALTDALEAVSLLQQEAIALRKEIIEAYDEEYAEFLEWVYQVLCCAALEDHEATLALKQYAQTYPNREELQASSLQVLVEGPIKIPSLLERSRSEVELAKQQMAQEANAIERQKLNLLQRSQQTLEQTLISTLYDAQTRSRDEADGKLAILLESFNHEGVDCTSRTGQKWETLINRLEVLAQYDSSLEQIISKGKQLSQLYLSDTPNIQSVQYLLEDFRVMLKERVQQTQRSGEGLLTLTKALALDAGYTELLSQLDAIASLPDPEQLRHLRGKLASMESLFKFRTKDLASRWMKAENAVRKSLGLDEISKPRTHELTEIDATDNNKNVYHDSNDTTQPYDSEAGF